MEALITRGSHLPEQGESYPSFLRLAFTNCFITDDTLDVSAKLAPAAIRSTYSRTRTAYVG